MRERWDTLIRAAATPSNRDLAAMLAKLLIDSDAQGKAIVRLIDRVGELEKKLASISGPV